MKQKLLFLIALCFSTVLIAQTTFGPIQNIDPDTGDEPYELEAGDLDGDGDIDLVMAANSNPDDVVNFIKWYSNDGAGNFTVEATVSSTIQWVDGLAVANIDGLFGEDIIVSSVNQNKIVYFLSDGLGGFGSEVLIDNINAPGELVAGDINMDGNIDIAVAAFTANKTAWYSGDGAGNFTAETDIVSGANNPFYMDIGDYDGDTDLDVVVGFFTGQSIEIYYNQYIESGSTAVSWVKDTETVDSGDSFILHVGMGDVNNDGNMDIFKVDFNTGDVEWYDKDKDMPAVVGSISNSTIITNPAELVIVDIDGDTFNDAILTDFGNADDALIWFKGANNAPPSATPTVITDNNFQMLALAIEDFDGDSDLDIASLGNTSDTVFWYENELFTLGVNGFESNTVSMYPNPTKDLVNFSGLQESKSVSVFSLLGEKVMEATINDNKALDISSLASGVYVLQFEGSEDTRRLVKQ